MAGETLKFAPWASEIELGFYSSLASLKINHDKLDDSARKLLGLYEVRPGDPPNNSSRMQIRGNALTTDEAPSNHYRAEGIFKNVNTIEEYKNLDRSAIIERAGRTVWDAILDDSIYSCPSLLASFYAISYADLKKYKFTYHFAFPALHSDPPWKIVEDAEHQRKLSREETTALVDAVQTWKYQVDSRQHGFFLAIKDRSRYSLQEQDEDDEQDQRPKTPRTPKADIGFRWRVVSLSSYDQGFFRGVDKRDRFICFADPSTYTDNPGWPLRNLLVLIKHKWHLEEAQILCYRDTHLRRDQANSIILQVKSPIPPAEKSQSAPTSESRPKSPVMPKVTGWERNENQKLSSRLIDLGAQMDPQRLADQAVDLNLRLIKWRLVPNINLEIIKDTKCLLLGAGTLGSYVARLLMGWGVRKITVVDNANVSFSNPVRQPLFDFKDCLDGGAKKAYRAAEMLQEIYPGVDSVGHVMSVPMAGHPIVDEEKVKREFDLLKELIEAHDAIFLLMDTRESRWLPTVMGKAAGKIVLNAALGFDTFVVMRHGLEKSKDGEEEMGCYFCNDVVAPANSIKDATLDQQCTVTRPGVAPLASALLVELLVSILQHPLKAGAPATTTQDSASSAFQASEFTNSPSTPSSSQDLSKFVHPLGAVPHQIRGFMNTFQNMSITGKPYDCCSACSPGILQRYRNDGWDFVKRALNERGWVEEISGLAEVQRKAELAEADVEWDESGEEEGEGELI